MPAVTGSLEEVTMMGDCNKCQQVSSAAPHFQVAVYADDWSGPLRS